MRSQTFQQERLSSSSFIRKNEVTVFLDFLIVGVCYESLPGQRTPHATMSFTRTFNEALLRERMCESIIRLTANWSLSPNVCHFNSMKVWSYAATKKKKKGKRKTSFIMRKSLCVIFVMKKSFWAGLAPVFCHHELQPSDTQTCHGMFLSFSTCM